MIRSLTRHPARARWYALGAALLLALALLLGRAALKADERARALAAENDAAEAFFLAPPPLPVPPPSFSPDEFYALQREVSRAGLFTEEISQLPAVPTEKGEILKMNLKGSGTFLQVLSLFDIIHMKSYWVRADLVRLSRTGPLLSFEMELSAYRSRGTYEKEKHRTDRSDGHGEEPGGENTR